MRHLHRLLRHRRTPRSAGMRHFSPSVLARFQDTILEGRRLHQAHLHLAIETALSSAALLAGCTPRQRAQRLFAVHDITLVPARRGLLLYLNLADRRIELIADRGLDGLVTPAQWQSICTQLAHACACGEFESGIHHALREVNQLLALVLPVQADQSRPL